MAVSNLAREAQKLSVDKITPLLVDDEWVVSSVIESALDIGGMYETIESELIQLAVSSSSVDNCIETLEALLGLLSTPYALSEDFQSRLDPIFDLFSSSKEPLVRSKALELLFRGYIYRESKVTVETIILQGLNDSVDSVRLTAAKLCEQFDFQDNITILERLSDLFINDSSAIRRSCARALIWNEQFNRDESIASMEIAYSIAFDDDIEGQDLRGWLLKIMKLGNEACDLKVVNFIKLKYRELIEKAAIEDDVSGLFYFSPSIWNSRKMNPQKEIIDILISLFEHQNPHVRQLAFTICSFVAPQSMSPIQALSFIKDDNIKVRANAIRRLPSRFLSHSQVIDTLFETLIENIPEVSESVVSTLSRIEIPEDKEKAAERAGLILAKHPKNIYVYELLWNLVVYDRPPFLKE